MKQGDIVLVQFPFSNLAEKKLRPAVVLSNEHYNRYANVLLAGIFSKQHPFSVPITNADMQKRRLVKASYVGLENMFSIEKTLIRHTIDALTSEKRKTVLTEARKCF